jgi:lipoate-protein ligase A
VPWLDSQLVYHAFPRVGLEGLIILAPAQPYVCIGYHQDLGQEVDVAYCQEHDIPIFRREVGGGAVFLDGQQLFYQLVLHKDSPLAVGDKSTFYKRLLQPVVETYGDLGVPCRYRPVNDIVTADGRKISGNGAATIGDYVVLVGNLIADFDYQTMVRVLRVPDEKYRDKVSKSMQENLTTLRRETGRLPCWDEMVVPLVARFEQVLGPLEPSVVPPVVLEKVEELKPLFLSQEWLYKKGRTRPGREVTIASGVNVVQRLYKAPGGLLRATLELKGDRLTSVSLSGDFFCYPQDAVAALEAELAGASLERVAGIVVEYYSQGHVDSPGVTPEDWLRVLLPATTEKVLLP